MNKSMLAKNIKKVKLYINNMVIGLKFNNAPLFRTAIILTFVTIVLMFLFFIGILLIYGSIKTKIFWESLLVISGVTIYKLRLKNKQYLGMGYSAVLIFIFIWEFDQCIDENSMFIRMYWLCIIIIISVAVALKLANNKFQREIATYLIMTKNPIKNEFCINMKSKKIKKTTECPFDTFKSELDGILQKIDENCDYYCVTHRTIKFLVYRNKNLELLEEHLIKEKSLKKIREILINTYCKNCEDEQKRKCVKKYNKKNEFYAIRFRKKDNSN